MTEFRRDARIEALFFADDGVIPNHPAWPLLLYAGALLPDAADAAACEALFHANRWRGGWRNGIFAEHHYHPDAHEVLGIVRGSARVTFGGLRGRTVDLSAGDVAVLPAGTGHKRESATSDLLVVGAYPDGMACGTIFADPAAYARAVGTIARTPLPACDPVFGPDGPLMERWK